MTLYEKSSIPITQMIEPFTYTEYRTILETLRDSWYLDFVNYRTGMNLIQNSDAKGFAIIRHDVDVSLQKALKLAEIEKSMGVSATYFILADTMAYNLNFSEHIEEVFELIDLGHEIGLHFYINEGEGEKEIMSNFTLQRNALQVHFATVIDVMTFHCPHKLSKELDTKFDIINGSDEPFLTKIKYFSDGWGDWRYGHPLESKEVEERRPLHLSFHPVWWNERKVPPLVALNEAVKDQNEAFKWYVAQNMIGF